MQTFKAMAASLVSKWGCIDENLDAIRKRIRQAGARGARLLLLPECCLSGANWPQTQTRPAPADVALKLGDPAVEAIVSASADAGIYTAFGLYERNGKKINITQAIAGPGGLVGACRKVHEGRLSSTEAELFPVFELPFARIGISICYDNMFPECARILALKGAEVLLAPFTSLPLSRQAWKDQRLTILRARAMDNRMFVLSASHAEPHVKGRPAEWGYSGICTAINPLGTVLATSSGRTGSPQSVAVTFKEADQRTYVTADVPSMRNRRAADYAELTDAHLQKEYLKNAAAFEYNDLSNELTARS